MADSTAETERYIYTERVGGACKTVEWVLERAALYRLTYRTEDQLHVTTTDPTLATQLWRCDMPAGGTAIEARREGNRIFISGHYNGEPIGRQLEIDGAPWYQATSLSLRGLVLGNHSSATFWTIRSDTLDAHKLVAVKQGVENLSIDGVQTAAVRIQLRLTGLLSPFWKSNYWFRRDDGVFLRFSGPTGPPGDPEMVVAFQGLSGQVGGCAQRPSQEAN